MKGYAAGLKSYAPGVIPWIYPHEEVPPVGVKLHILQEGCVSIQSQWSENAGYIGWQRMFQRDHEKEREYKNILLMRSKKVL